jgi:hypothetical protein
MGMLCYAQVLANGIFAGKIFPNELAAHNHLARSRDAFVIGKEPAVHQRNSKGAETTWIGPARQPLGQAFARLWRSMFLYRECEVTPIPRGRDRVSQCSGANPGHGSHSLQQCFIECVYLLWRVVFLLWKAVLQREHVFGTAAHIGCAQPQKAFQQQPPSNQQDHRDSNLQR